ncbi:unnamed protein product [Soboliphyme baturini]|uniref:Histone acetyltransferase n=1 Tax=Soboliphyme baturini TaxID=241478 RepID=A0A183IMS8_9BILA|nr:unnamed protein product [Soboliphyme baturini]
MQAMVVAPKVSQPDCSMASSDGGGTGVNGTCDEPSTSVSPDLQGLLNDMKFWKRQAVIKTEKFRRKLPEFEFDCVPGSEKEREIRMMCERHLENKMKKMEQEYMKNKSLSFTPTTATDKDQMFPPGSVQTVEQLKRKRRRGSPAPWSESVDTCSCNRMGDRADMFFNADSVGVESGGGVVPYLDVPRDDAGAGCSRAMCQGATNVVTREAAAKQCANDHLNRFASDLNLPRHVIEDIFQSTPCSFDPSVVDAVTSQYLSELDRVFGTSSTGTVDPHAPPSTCATTNGSAILNSLCSVATNSTYEAVAHSGIAVSNSLFLQLVHDSGNNNVAELKQAKRSMKQPQPASGPPVAFDARFSRPDGDDHVFQQQIHCFKKERLEIDEDVRQPYFIPDLVASADNYCATSAIASKMVPNADCPYVMNGYRIPSESSLNPTFFNSPGVSYCNLNEQQRYFEYQRDGPVAGLGPRFEGPYSGVCASQCIVGDGPSYGNPSIRPTMPPPTQVPYCKQDGVPGEFIYNCFGEQPRPCQYSNVNNISSMNSMMDKYSLN